MKKFVIGLLTILALTACGSGSSESIQGEWELVSYDIGSGQTPAIQNVETYIEFDPEGRMTGNVGCNGFGGGYTLDNDTIEFDPIESTLMFCEGPVGEQELGTFTVLQNVTTYSIDGNQLTITSSDGYSSIVLERK